MALPQQEERQEYRLTTETTPDSLSVVEDKSSPAGISLGARLTQCNETFPPKTDPENPEQENPVEAASSSLPPTGGRLLHIPRPLRINTSQNIATTVERSPARSRQFTRRDSIPEDLQFSPSALSKGTSLAIPCRFFRSGKCTAGSECAFSHDIDFSKEVCKFYLRGSCKFGHKCALAHVPGLSRNHHGLAHGSLQNLRNSDDYFAAYSSSYGSRGGGEISPGIDELVSTGSWKVAASSSALRAQPLPSPDSIKHPRAPPPIRHKSMPDIFRWSADDGNPYPSSNFLFFSSSFEEDSVLQAENAMKGKDARMRQDLCDSRPESCTSTYSRPLSTLRHLRDPRLAEGAGNTTPDPFSPFPGDFSDETDEETTFVMDLAQRQETSPPLPFLMEDTSELSVDELAKRVKMVQLRSIQLCPFAIDSKCKFGEKCRYIHGLTCPSCHRDCLHPYRPELHEAHISECNKNEQRRQQSQKILCSMCGRSALARGKIGLLECEHPYCLICIRSTRPKDAISEAVNCTICGHTSSWITPSSFWPVDAKEKRMVMEQYRLKIASTPCRYFAVGRCPFGDCCFYAHFGGKGGKPSGASGSRTSVPGTADNGPVRVVSSEKAVKILSSFSLADFIKESNN